MPIKLPFPTSGEPDQDFLHRAFFVEQVSLLLVFQVALFNLLSYVFAPISHFLPVSFHSTSITSALEAVCSTIALFLTEPNRSCQAQRIGKALAGLTTVFAAISLSVAAGYSRLLALRSWLVRVNGLQPQPSTYISSTLFLLLGIAILLVRARQSSSARIADAVTSVLGFLMLITSSEFVFASASVPGATVDRLPSSSSIACLALLVIVIFLRRADSGIFAVFLEGGIGGRIARIIAPFILLIPFAREVARARLLDAQLIPIRYATAVLTSITVLIGFALLILLARIITGMQSEIENLTLRDELTGLYNFRGFNLFAEQTFRLARRARQPFGVLFVDMDNLKTINDECGHNAGSACLVEIAKLLSATFRETDVIGRLGGDEFVVAGQFDTREISHAMERLRSNDFNSQLPELDIALTMSLGYAATDSLSNETMKSVLARADKAMYKEKRAKKRLVVKSAAAGLGVN